METILGLLAIFLIFSFAELITAIEDAPYWDEEHGFYTASEIEDLEHWAERMRTNFNLN